MARFLQENALGEKTITKEEKNREKRKLVPPGGRGGVAGKGGGGEKGGDLTAEKKKGGKGSGKGFFRKEKKKSFQKGGSILWEGTVKEIFRKGERWNNFNGLVLGGRLSASLRKSEGLAEGRVSLKWGGKSRGKEFRILTKRGVSSKIGPATSYKRGVYYFYEEKKNL